MQLAFFIVGCPWTSDIIIIIIINGTLARSLEPVVTECKEHTIRTQTKTSG